MRYKAKTEKRCFILFKRPQQRTVHLEAQFGPINNMSTPIISMKNGNKLYADSIGFESTSSLFESPGPDACIVTTNGEVLPLELTVCHELNFEKARDYKEKRYRDLRKDLKINCIKFEISFIEISALGFVPTSRNLKKKRVRASE